MVSELTKIDESARFGMAREVSPCFYHDKPQKYISLKGDVSITEAYISFNLECNIFWPPKYHTSK